MFEYMKGLVTSITPAYVVLEVGGIGYQLACGNPYAYQEGQIATIYVHQVVREDAHTLYGFRDLEEKQLFLQLISVSGIGPKSGLAIMASSDHSGLVHAIEASDVTYLTRFPGVGKKTAQQMILDLQGKLSTEAVPQAPAADQALDEALAALTALGYSEREVKRIEKQLAQEPVQATDDYLRLGLKLLMKK